MTNDATDNLVNPTSSTQPSPDAVSAGGPTAGGETPRLFARQVLSGNARGIQQFGSPNLFADSGNNYFGVSKNTIQQVLMGLQPTFGEGFYVTKDGIDVSKTTSAEDFIFNSNQDVFKIVKAISFSSEAYVTGTTGVNQVLLDVGLFKIDHGLDFIPAVVGYAVDDFNNPGAYFELPRTLVEIAGDNIRYSSGYLQLYATQTQVVFEIDVFLSALTSGGTLNSNVVSFNVLIFLLQESANATNN